MPLEMLEETAGTSRRVEPIGRTRGRLNLGIELSVTKFNVKIKNNWFKKYGISCFFFVLRIREMRPWTSLHLLTSISSPTRLVKFYRQVEVDGWPVWRPRMYQHDVATWLRPLEQKTGWVFQVVSSHDSITSKHGIIIIEILYICYFIHLNSTICLRAAVYF